jgi:hypothetical protein
VIAHQSALAIHELSDVSPARTNGSTRGWKGSSSASASGRSRRSDRRHRRLRGRSEAAPNGAPASAEPRRRIGGKSPTACALERWYRGVTRKVGRCPSEDVRPDAVRFIHDPLPVGRDQDGRCRHSTLTGRSPRSPQRPDNPSRVGDHEQRVDDEIRPRIADDPLPVHVGCTPVADPRVLQRHHGGNS